MQEQRDTLTDLVDHIIPVVDRPDLLHEWKNLWALCRYHHGRKFSLEIYARDNGLLEMLPMWCRDPTMRPPEFR
ncbi:HNH endonuclease [Shinella zoogloeoides]|uniref:HNH endonuclease n=1 Tax=Shinella zoogloeoides TaxID=352475 RepID=UPI0039A75A61